MSNFIKDTLDEVKKLQTPSRKEVYFTTLTVLITIIVASLLILVSDFLISKIIAIIFGL
jgi:preprotein translocase SecE subunit